MFGERQWTPLEGIPGTAAAVARAALPASLVFFSAFDSAAGLATWWLAQTANKQTGPDQAAIHRGIEDLFIGNELAGNLFVAGAVAAVSRAVTAIGGAMALRHAGADRLTVAFVAAGVLCQPIRCRTGTIGMLAMFVAAYRWNRRPTQGRRTTRYNHPRQPAGLGNRTDAGCEEAP